jgi:hypothetical protein
MNNIVQNTADKTTLIGSIKIDLCNTFNSIEALAQFKIIYI